MRSEWWHVVWTTAFVWSPADARGDWDELSRAYAGFADRVRMSHPLDRAWKATARDQRAVALSPVARTLVADAIRDLAKNDRIAGDTPIRALAVLPHAVHVVLACPEHALHQRAGRLKSRTATLLSFDAEAGVGGKGTWSGGFWWARLEEDGMLNTIDGYVRRLAAAF